jgi:hypothetical protein
LSLLPFKTPLIQYRSLFTKRHVAEATADFIVCTIFALSEDIKASRSHHHLQHNTIQHNTTRQNAIQYTERITCPQRQRYRRVSALRP